MDQSEWLLYSFLNVYYTTRQHWKKIVEESIICSCVLQEWWGCDVDNQPAADHADCPEGPCQLPGRLVLPCPVPGSCCLPACHALHWPLSQTHVCTWFCLLTWYDQWLFFNLNIKNQWKLNCVLVVICWIGPEGHHCMTEPWLTINTVAYLRLVENYPFVIRNHCDSSHAMPVGPTQP